MNFLFWCFHSLCRILCWGRSLLANLNTWSTISSFLLKRYCHLPVFACRPICACACVCVCVCMCSSGAMCVQVCAVQVPVCVCAVQVPCVCKYVLFRCLCVYVQFRCHVCASMCCSGACVCVCMCCSGACVCVHVCAVHVPVYVCVQLCV